MAGADGLIAVTPIFSASYLVAQRAHAAPADAFADPTPFETLLRGA